MDAPEIGIDDGNLAYAATIVNITIRTMADFDGLAAVLAD